MQELYTCPSCPPEKAILSTYPLGYTRPNRLPAHRLPTLLCADGFRHEDAQGTPIPPSLRLRARVLLVPPRSVRHPPGLPRLARQTLTVCLLSAAQGAGAFAVLGRGLLL